MFTNCLKLKHHLYSIDNQSFENNKTLNAMTSHQKMITENAFLSNTQLLEEIGNTTEYVF